MCWKSTLIVFPFVPSFKAPSKSPFTIQEKQCSYISSSAAPLQRQTVGDTLSSLAEDTKTLRLNGAFSVLITWRKKILSTCIWMELNKTSSYCSHSPQDVTQHDPYSNYWMLNTCSYGWMCIKTTKRVSLNIYILIPHSGVLIQEVGQRPQITAIHFAYAMDLGETLRCVRHCPNVKWQQAAPGGHYINVDFH